MVSNNIQNVESYALFQKSHTCILFLKRDGMYSNTTHNINRNFYYSNTTHNINRNFYYSNHTVSFKEKYTCMRFFNKVYIVTKIIFISCNQYNFLFNNIKCIINNNLKIL